MEDEAPPKYILGLMSGSSLDGLDLVYTVMGGDADRIVWEIADATTVPLPTALISRIRNWVRLGAEEFIQLERDFTLAVTDIVNQFIQDQCHSLDLIVFHGHTLLHQPQEKISVQIGQGGTLAAMTGYPVLCDLRIQNVALGGQGAPLAAIVDQYLFKHYNFLLNIGGIANVTVQKGDTFESFDIVAANQVLNHLAQRENMSFDDGGKIAKTGEIIHEWLENLKQSDFYTKSPPKSLDNNWINQQIIDHIPQHIATKDLLKTYIEFIVYQVAYQIGEFAGDEPSSMLITGGGAFNTYLVEQLEKALKAVSTKVYVADENLVNYKEGLLMALMGYLYTIHQPNVLGSVTGSNVDLMAGALYQGTKTWI